MTLVIIVLITVVTVGYLASVMLETKTAGASLDQERAYGIAMVGAHKAMSQIRDALGPWDDPYKNFATSPTNFYWSLSPGRITRWEYTSTNSTNYPLFSGEPGTTNLVNLNRQLSDQSYPIIGGTNPPDISVKWVNLWRDPSQPASATNAIVGRYAFWVDDEGAKININTADGTEKYTNSKSLGIGTPSEVSLEAMLGGTNAKAVVQIARTTGFNSPREMLRASGVAPNDFTDNVFSLTAYSRSPDLNVFGQPKMALAPMLGRADYGATDMVTNGITMRAVREIYPTPSQLPKLLMQQIGRPGTYTNSWPLAFRQGAALFTGGHRESFELADSPNSYLKLDNYCFVNGMLLAKYMSGTNGAGAQVRWPVFQGSSSTGFAGKYSKRQIDSIVAQICNLGSQAVSPDYPYISTGGSFDKGFGEQPYDGGSAPVLFPGWLSGQWVSGMGRSPKVTSLLLKFSTIGSSGDLQGTNYVPAKASLDVWVEWWLPAAFRGSTQSGAQVAKNFGMGHRAYKGILNSADAVPDTEWHGTNGPPPPVPTYWWPQAILGGYWNDKLLRNNLSIDFSGSPSPRFDPEQVLGTKVGRAPNEHDPFARLDRTNANGPWMGTGTLADELSSPLKMSEMTISEAWRPGRIRTFQNQFGGISGVWLAMNTNASSPGSTLQISGGIAIQSQMLQGYHSEADPVPLEAIRGPITSSSFLNREPYSDSANTPGNPSETVRDRALASVIPVNVTVSIPPHSPVPPLSYTPTDRWLLLTVEDPLVNKFPGDWEPSESPGPPTTAMKYSEGSYEPVNAYDEDSSWRGSLKDPDSYWMPEIDCALYPGQTPLIPRSARLPNIGYLQYVRTGIIPDDESVPYAEQKGTPFRLLSFAPSYEARDVSDPLVGQQTTNSISQSYPDWALLDLLYVPSTLTPVGGPYGSSTNLDYYGTFGGATAGRINPNGTVIYTTNVNEPNSVVSRPAPLMAVLHGVRVNQKIQGSGTNSSWSPGTNVPAVAILQQIESYLRTNGPFRMPAELCNITEIADLRPSVNRTRNDLIRQIVGTLTTQGNVFSVWAVGQAIKKKPASTKYGEFETGDNVLAEVRLHFIVERYLDPGADNVYGNNGDFGPDGVLGTYDDPTDTANHPFQPRYLYRVIASEEIR
jgi:hypothetical protein